MPMDLSEPYTTVCPSLEGPVLEVLAQTTRPLTGREIARLAKRGSERGVRLVLNRMAEAGLVDRRTAGSASLYVLNREHVAAPLVLELVRLRQECFDRIRQAIGGWELQPVHASIFGSAARGDGDAHSDVDLLVVRRDEIEAESDEWVAQLDLLARRVRRWSGNDPAIAELSMNQLHAAVRRQEPIISDLREASITVAGTDFSDLIRASELEALA